VRAASKKATPKKAIPPGVTPLKAILEKAVPTEVTPETEPNRDPAAEANSRTIC
jgi:hypothetical protein